MSNLKPCRTCEQPVAPLAATCPKCGASNPGSSSTTITVAALVVVGVLVVFIGSCAMLFV